jgi:acyl-CoA dehydrogenase
MFSRRSPPSPRNGAANSTTVEVIPIVSNAGRGVYSEEHEAFRATVRRFFEEELAPHHAEWEEAGMVPRSVWRRAGELGLLCVDLPTEYGGAGGDYLFNAVIIEEAARAGITGPGFNVHSEMVAPYIHAWGSEEIKRKWLPAMARGESIGALAITEPGAGSDLRGLKTSAVRDGNRFIVNGQKIYISNGQSCDLIVLACRIPESGRDATGISLLLVEAASPGFSRGRNLKKIGFRAQDTSELFFSDMAVPADNLLGTAGGGLKMLMSKLPRERLSQAIRSIAIAEAALGWTVAHTRERKAFGGTIADFQNTQFTLASLAAEISALRVFVDHCIETNRRGELTSVLAAKAKLLSTDLHCRTVDRCLQFFGGFGYMLDSPIGRAYADARVTRIAGGADELMKQIIARDLYA